MPTVRDAMPKPRDLAKAEFATLRLRLIRFPKDQFGNRIPLARKSALRLKDFRAISFSRIAKRSCGNRMIKIAARVTETASRVRLAFAVNHPQAELFASLPGALGP